MPIINSIITDTTNITENGTYDVTRYTTANVNVEGTQPTYTTIRISPSTNTETFWPSDFGGDAFESVLAEGVTSDIDSNIQAGNIKKDVQILGVTGTYEGGGGSAEPALQYHIVDGTIEFPSDTVIDLCGATDVGTNVFNGLYQYRGFYPIINVDFSSLTSLSGSGACQFMFESCGGVGAANLSGLITISGSEAAYCMFSYCSNLIILNLSSLTTISGSYACYAMADSNSELTTVYLNNLTTVSGTEGAAYMLGSNDSLQSINLGSLTTISGTNGCKGMLNFCSNLTSVDLHSLTTITGDGCCQNMFEGTALTSLSFPALTSSSFGDYTNQFDDMLQSTQDCVVHFPSNLQSVIGSWSSVQNGFSGTNTTVLFDLPATE